MILGICGSGRKNGNSSKAVKTILESTGEEYEYISLSSKKINGCIGCTKCAKNNRCVVNDDFNEIADKLLKADAIVFAAPSYYKSLNTLSRAFWERCFCFRHRDRAKLAGKLCVTVGVAYSKEEQDIVNSDLEKYLNSNHMKVISKIGVLGYSQCYTCGYGVGCISGNVVNKHGLIEEIKEEHLPTKFEDNKDDLLQLKKAGILLGRIVRDKNVD